MTSILMIGIDGLDSLLLSTFKNDLPNFKKIIDHSPSIKFQSVFPPDSVTAWVSIYTGLTPANHGVVFFKNPLNSKRIALETRIHEKTFWKYAERKGKRVCALYPFLPINPSYDQVYPSYLTKKYEIGKYELLPLYSSWNLKKVIDTVKKRTLTQCKIGLDIYKDSKWDLFFIYFPDLDNIEHIFWKFHDKEHPEYRSNNPYESTIPEMYKFFDREVIGIFLEAANSDIFIVLSDHGHTKRPLNIININEILRRANLLSLKKGSGNAFSNKVLCSLRRTIIKSINNNKFLRWMLARMWKILPEQNREKFSKATPIDWQRSIAVLSEPGYVEGLKTYNYAGIKINENMINSEEAYEKICQNIINLISEIRDSKSRIRIVEWICKREQLYSGKYISNYPDIIFKLKDKYGVGADINCPVITNSYSYKIYSGMHKLENPIFVLNSIGEAEINVQNNEMTLMDVAPTILDILDVKCLLSNFDGKSILRTKLW